MNALDKAIQSVGSLTAFAKRVGVSPQVVANWRSRGVPAARVLKIEAATADKNGRPRVLRQDLRPDLYPERETA